MDADLMTRWCHLLDGPAAVPVGRELLARYAQAHRRYHDVTHLREVLDAVEVLAPYAVDVTAVRLAAWFHDAVYDGRPGDDEEASARLAEERLPACGVDPIRIAEVARLVRLTATHAVTDGDTDGGVLCDADLSILGADPRRYDRYAAGVRAEYAHIPPEVFRTGRLAVLERLRNRAGLYLTPAAHQRWSAAARDNLTREIGQLRTGGGSCRPGCADRGQSQGG